jgi:hypothetical protein
MRIATQDCRTVLQKIMLLKLLLPVQNFILTGSGDVLLGVADQKRKNAAD